MYTRTDLEQFAPAHESFVGIDSDGCVFDTMEVKQTKCFHPLIISHWQLEPIAPLVRDVAEFVNLYSRRRGRNRFLSLADTMDFLRARPDVVASGVPVPELKALRRWMAEETQLGNPTLKRVVEESGDAELRSVLEWSEKVNARVSEVVQGLAPFAGVVESLERIRVTSDAIVVSQTPEEALVREWRENSIDGYVAMIAGQELGTKAEHLELATAGRYDEGKVLMIGDAPGDAEAAAAAGALFYPINPGQEEVSWARFLSEAYDRFLEGTYAGEYEAARIAEFDALLPETPPWL